MTTAYQLRRAAEHEIVKASASSHTSVKDILHDASEALSALSTLLGEDQWFFGSERAALFDASVFAYTHLLLEDGLEWKDNQLREQIEKYGNLVQHRRRILELYY